MPSSYEKARALLPHLSIDELRNVRSLVDLLLTTGAGAGAAPKNGVKRDAETTRDKHFYSELAEFLNTELGARYPPFEIASRSVVKKVMPRLRLARQSLDEGYLSMSKEGKLPTLDARKRYYRLYCQLTAQYLRRVKVPVTARTLIQHADKFGALLDEAFPGYIAAGQIGAVLNPTTRRPGRKRKPL